MGIEVAVKDGEQVFVPFLLRLGGWTEERYFAEAPDNQIWEFEEGELIIHSPASTRHQRIVGFLNFLLRGYVEERGLGEVLNGPAVLRLREGVCKEPDVFFVAKESQGNIKSIYTEGSADLVMEVISPSTRTYDLVEKARVYHEEGVREYWAIDPEHQQVTIQLLGQVEVRKQGKLLSAVVPGFWIEIGWLWQENLPAALNCLREILSSESG